MDGEQGFGEQGVVRDGGDNVKFTVKLARAYEVVVGVVVDEC